MNYQRLKRQKEIAKVFHDGNRAHGGTLTVVYFPCGQLKMAVCVGKKFGGSVLRNRIKRLLREAFRTAADNVKTCAVLLIPKVREEYSYQAFLRDIQRIFKKEHLIETEISGDSAK